MVQVASVLLMLMALFWQIVLTQVDFNTGSLGVDGDSSIDGLLTVNGNVWSMVQVYLVVTMTL